MADQFKVSKAALFDGLKARGPIFAPDEDGRWNAVEGDGLPELGAIRPKRPARDLFVQPARQIASWKNHVSQPELQPAVVDKTPGSVYGVRPCDARALSWLDQIFLAEPYVDPHYKAKRENLLTVGMACDPEPSCHCGLFDFGPDEASEMDILLHPQGDDFVAVAGSKRGGEFLAGLKGTEEAKAPDKREGPKPEWWAGFPEPDAMMAAFEHPVWEDLIIGCMNCGACTLYCPTCQCFTIVDETHKGLTERRRVIDTCQHGDFTRMAGGHNPRDQRHPRLRQRVMHKFSYIPTKYDGQLGCSGCGRCVELCGLKRHLFADLTAIKQRISQEKNCGT